MATYTHALLFLFYLIAGTKMIKKALVNHTKYQLLRPKVSDRTA